MGKDVNLVVVLQTKDVEVQFGVDDADMVLNYTLQMKIYKDLAENEPEYFDEMKVITGLKAEADDDVVYLTLLEHKLDVDAHFESQTAPKNTTLDITTGEYREFLSSFGFYMNYLRKYMNNVVFKNGIKFPYNP